ncbi:hypothetical protein PNOK_0880500 [Pyrrhoderma noxium]|uniref:Uncharacterized protein n=1 Tax=Pyrrhoderma noxium TaxID=2282107 RepID=A0A286U8M9_9AGAM|nr:hypothetical protein PNOK_0880500 [Pyrrhoderma noxium]
MPGNLSRRNEAALKESANVINICYSSNIRIHVIIHHIVLTILTSKTVYLHKAAGIWHQQQDHYNLPKTKSIRVLILPAGKNQCEILLFQELAPPMNIYTLKGLKKRSHSPHIFNFGPEIYKILVQCSSVQTRHGVDKRH